MAYVRQPSMAPSASETAARPPSVPIHSSPPPPPRPPVTAPKRPRLHASSIARSTLGVSSRRAAYAFETKALAPPRRDGRERLRPERRRRSRGDVDRGEPTGKSSRSDTAETFFARRNSQTTVTSPQEQRSSSCGGDERPLRRLRASRSRAEARTRARRTRSDGRASSGRRRRSRGRALERARETHGVAEEEDERRSLRCRREPCRRRVRARRRRASVNDAVELARGVASVRRRRRARGRARAVTMGSRPRRLCTVD